MEKKNMNGDVVGSLHHPQEEMKDVFEHGQI
jgi:hypothetical protein